MGMVRYYQTQLTLAHLEGGAFFKPLFFEFPDDSGALDASQEKNIMLGEALKLSVLTNQLDTNTTDYYFPAGTWCPLFHHSGVEACSVVATGANYTLPSKAYDFHLHLRDGYIVPMQDGRDLVTTKGARTTTDL